MRFVPRKERPIAYRITTSRLLLRGWEPADASALCAALEENLDHLRPWLPWVAFEPEPVGEKLKKLQQWRAEFERGVQFRFGIFEPATSEILGSIGFHNRIGAGALEIGYWVRADRTRQGIATEATAALVRIGFEVLQLRRIEIHCDPANAASAGVPRRLGFRQFTHINNQCHDPAMKPRNTIGWAMREPDCALKEIAEIRMQAFDALGNPLLPK